MYCSGTSFIVGHSGHVVGLGHAILRRVLASCLIYSFAFRKEPPGNIFLAISKILLMMYCWCCDMPQHLICREADMLLGHTVVDWSNFFRDEAENYVERQSREIGGMDLNGEAITVEIDESKFFHRKYHRGQWRQGHWVFGGIERESGKCFWWKLLIALQIRWKLKLGNTFYPGLTSFRTVGRLMPIFHKLGAEFTHMSTWYISEISWTLRTTIFTLRTSKTCGGGLRGKFGGSRGQAVNCSPVICTSSYSETA